MGKGAVEAVYETTAGDVRSALRFLLTHPQVSGGEIARALRRDGHQVNRHQVEHFRRKIADGNYDLDTIGKSHESG